MLVILSHFLRLLSLSLSTRKCHEADNTRVNKRKGKPIVSLSVGAFLLAIFSNCGFFLAFKGNHIVGFFCLSLVFFWIRNID